MSMNSILFFILNKNLIQISINKSQNYEVVQNKLREQINESLYGKTNIIPNYENDLVNVEKKINSKIDFINSNSDKTSLNSNSNKTLLDSNSDMTLHSNLESKSNIRDTLNNYTNNNYERIDNNNDDDNINPFEGSDYSYI